jgi:F0F1-type ATP synthase membrane subunit c/vacuolar-type H+-ATPase subunit K
MPYIFVAAAALAVIPILILFKINVEKLKENPEVRGKVQTNFMIGVAVSEIIPIILIIFGFVNMEQAANIEELYIPGLIILFIMAFSVFFIFLQKNVGVDPAARTVINAFSIVSIPLSTAIPIISLIALFLMAP